MNKKTFFSVFAILLFFAAIWIGLNSVTVMPYVWRLWNGQNANWNGVKVELNDNEYFMPASSTGKTLIIADLKSKDAFIVLHAGARTRLFQKIYVDSLCRPDECSQMNEQLYAVNNRSVSSFSFIKQDVNLRTITFHQYIVIDGGNAWLEYFGSESSYSAHKSTIDTMIQKIAELT